MAPEKVVVLGASPNPDRYSYKALVMLRDYGHDVVPVNPGQDEIEGIPVFRSLEAVPAPVDTVTMYVGPERGRTLGAAIAALKPRRVIFNPGSEDPETERFLESQGISVERACTLVLLKTGQY